ncbi:MAG: hypothetical protein J7K20_07250 [Thermodesulfobacterium sp.]|nr:hypothetical protein [Thermodesulfobacterium sp.]
MVATATKNLRHGIFTYYVAKGLLEGGMNKDGAVEVSELKNYLDEAKNYTCFNIK